MSMMPSAPKVVLYFHCAGLLSDRYPSTGTWETGDQWLRSPPRSTSHTRHFSTTLIATLCLFPSLCPPPHPLYIYVYLSLHLSLSISISIYMSHAFSPHCRSLAMQDIVRRYGPSLKDPAKAEPVAYGSHFDRLLREAERETAAAGRRPSASPKVGALNHDLSRYGGCR